MTDSPEAAQLPVLRLKRNEDRRLHAGHLWIFSNEVDTSQTPLPKFKAGELVRVLAHNDRALGLAYVNPQSLIAARLLETWKIPDSAWLAARIRAAMSLRDRLYLEPYYRLVYGESDGLPGLVVDRYGSSCVAQIGTAGMEALKPQILEALNQVVRWEAVLFKNDSAALSEKYRVPVMFMMDECVGHMTEKVIIPPADDIEVEPRHKTHKAPGTYKPYECNGDGSLVPEMAHAGEGYKFHVTGLTHDERGYPSMTVATQQKLVGRLQEKIRKAADDLVLVEEDSTADADVVVVSYGITSRVAQRGIDAARAKGLKVGKLRLKIVWPFPDALIKRLAKRAKAFVVPELNLGQISREVERAAAGVKTVCVPHAGGGVHR